MKKRKSEKDQSINKLKKRVKDASQANDKVKSKNDFDIHYMVIDTSDKLYLNLLIDRLQECIKAQSEYNDIRTIEQILMDGDRKISGGKCPKTHDAMSRTEFDRLTDMLVMLTGDANSNITNKQSLSVLFSCCLLLNRIDVYNLDFQPTFVDVMKYHTNKCFTMNKAHEVLGYWQPKAKQGKTNKENVKTRTTKKEERKDKIKEWMKTMKPKDCRLYAQKEFQVSERTILKYLQEIRDEETAIMRTKDVTA